MSLDEIAFLASLPKAPNNYDPNKNYDAAFERRNWVLDRMYSNNFIEEKDLIYKIVHSLFGANIKLRFRPSYFPFTEPSAEVDIMSKEGEWLEILGCGIVNPIVLENCNICSDNYKGLAFGLGVERIAMLKYGVGT